MTHRTQEWENIDNTLAVVLPYFYDLVFPPSICETCHGCSMYYRQLHSIDAEFLKNFKTINSSKSFVVTWYNARMMSDDKKVSCFILNIVFQKRHSATNSNIDDFIAEFPLQILTPTFREIQTHQILKIYSPCLIYCTRVNSKHSFSSENLK